MKCCHGLEPTEELKIEDHVSPREDNQITILFEKLYVEPIKVVQDTKSKSGVFNASFDGKSLSFVVDAAPSLKEVELTSGNPGVVMDKDRVVVYLKNTDTHVVIPKGDFSTNIQELLIVRPPDAIHTGINISWESGTTINGIAGPNLKAYHVGVFLHLLRRANSDDWVQLVNPESNDAVVVYNEEILEHIQTTVEEMDELYQDTIDLVDAAEINLNGIVTSANTSLGGIVSAANTDLNNIVNTATTTMNTKISLAQAEVVAAASEADRAEGAAGAAEDAKDGAEAAENNARDYADAALLSEQKAKASENAAEDAKDAAEAAELGALAAQSASEDARDDAEDAADIALSAAGPLQGGAAGQVLRKLTAADYSYEWATITGTGDMTALMYDPNGVGADAFDMDNMVEGATAKIMTSAERTKLSGIQTGAQVNSVTSVAGKTGAVVLTTSDIGGITAQGRALLDDADAVAMRTTLGLPRQESGTDISAVNLVTRVDGVNAARLSQHGSYYGASAGQNIDNELPGSIGLYSDANPGTWPRTPFGAFWHVTTQRLYLSDNARLQVAARYLTTGTPTEATTEQYFRISSAVSLSSWGPWQKVNTVTSVAGKTGAVTLAKSDVGLGNVDNTSDANKPVSTAQAAALGLKVDIAGEGGLGIFTSAVHDMGSSSGGPIKPSIATSNFKSLTNNAAFTLTAPDQVASQAYSMAILVLSSAGAGAMTASGFTDVSGDFDPAVANLLSITVIGTSKWLNIKAVE